MTTYILAGGNDRTTDPTYGDRLALVVRKIVDKPVILSCFLSWPVEQQHVHWQDYFTWFKQKFGDVEVLEATQANFYDLAKQADVIYLHGGHTKELLAHLPDFEKSKEAFQGKIVIGSSAGANYLSSYCISMSEGFDAVRGSGIIDQPVMVHYRAEQFNGTSYSSDDWTGAEVKLRELSGSRNTICLPEGSFAIVVR